MICCEIFMLNDIQKWKKNGVIQAEKKKVMNG